MTTRTTHVTKWYVYLLESAKGRTYVGCTVDLDRRLNEHNGFMPGGAKSTRGFRPWHVLRTWGPYPNRSVAQRIEALIKKQPGKLRRTYVLPASV